jgi:hypothetical protein
LSAALDALLAQAQASSGRCAARLRQHVLAQLLCLGRHTVTGLLCTAGRPFGDWSADYRLYARQRVAPAALFGVVRRAVAAQLAPGLPFVAALDDSIHRKRGRKIPGTAWRRDPLSPPFAVNWTWGERVLQLAALLPLTDEGLARALPIQYGPAPSATRPRRTAPPAAWADYRHQRQVLNLNRQGRQQVEHLRAQLDQERPGEALWIVSDGRFTNRTLLKNPPAGVTFIGRVRADAKLYDPPTPVDRGPRGGRPRTYGAARPTPAQVRTDESHPWQLVRAFAAGRTHAFRIKTLGPLRWRATGALDLRLIVIAPLSYRLTQHGQLLYRQPAYLLCTDPAAPLERVLQAYLWRWDIEVNFRDEKTVLGVGQAQVRNPHAVTTLPATAVAAYALLHLAAVQAFGPRGFPTGLPPPAWRRREPPRRATTMKLLNQLRWELWSHAIATTHLEHFPAATPANHKSPKPPPNPATSVFYAQTG